MIPSKANLGGAAASLRPSHAKTRFDDLLLPDGQRVGDVKYVTPVLLALCIPGVTSAAGRERNIECYAAFLDDIRSAGADAAVAQWLAEHKGAA